MASHASELTGSRLMVKPGCGIGRLVPGGPRTQDKINGKISISLPGCSEGWVQGGAGNLVMPNVSKSCLVFPKASRKLDPTTLKTW